MGAIRWGTWGTRPPTFSDCGNIIRHVPHIFLLRFRNILVSHQVVHPTFYNKIALMAAAPAWLLHYFPSSKSLDCPLSLNYLANWYQESSQFRGRACHAWFVFLSLFFLLLFHTTHVIHPSSSRFDPPGWFFWVFRRCPLSGAIEACVAWLCSHTFRVGLNSETSMALT